MPTKLNNMGVKQQYDERTGLFISGSAKDTPPK